MKRNEFTKEQLNEFISVIELQTPQKAKDYYILRNFAVDVDRDTNEKILIKKQDKGIASQPPRYVSIEENDYYIDMAHRRTIHGGIKKTYAALRKIARNVKLECVEKFIKEKCEPCKMKKKIGKLKNRIPPITSPIISNRFGQRCQVDLIDFRKFDLSNCQFVLNYQDNLTRFCLLRALPDKRAETILDNLIEIFCTFGAPTILHTDNGGEFRNKLITDYVTKFWPSLKMIRGKPYNPRSQGAVERANKDVKEIFLSLLNDFIYEANAKLILNYVQYLKNISVNRTIRCCPYKAIFGQDPVVELRAEHLTKFTFSDDEEKRDEENIQMIESKQSQIIDERYKVKTNTIIAAKKAIT